MHTYLCTDHSASSPARPYGSMFAMLGRERVFLEQGGQQAQEQEQVQEQEGGLGGGGLPTLEDFQPLARAVALCLVDERCVQCSAVQCSEAVQRGVWYSLCAGVCGV